MAFKTFVAIALLACSVACREPSVFNESRDSAPVSDTTDGSDAGSSPQGTGGAPSNGAGGSNGGGLGGIDVPFGSGGTLGCTPQPEDCFNSKDDDCDTKMDCADTDCGAQARCVPIAKDDFALGVSVEANEACPPGYSEPVTVKRGLRVAGECQGCSCTVSETKCDVELSYFKTAGECGADSGASQASPAEGNYGSCNWLLNGGSSIAGAKISSVRPSASCDVKGTPTPKAIEWLESRKFCKHLPGPIGGGCAPEQICVVKANAPACVFKSGDNECPKPYATAYSWFTGAVDNRTCTSCGCTVKGGACPSPAVNVYYGYNCNSAVEFTLLGEGNKICSNVSYGPVARYTGQVEAAACASSAQVTSGSATPTGQMALCCAP